MGIAPNVDHLRWDDGVDTFITKTVLTNAQFKALPTTGLPIVGAQPVSTRPLLPRRCTFVVDTTSGVYTNIDPTATMSFYFDIGGAVDVLGYVANDYYLDPQELQQSTNARVGGTAGWVLETGTNLPYIARLPAGQSASTLVVPVTGLRIGDYITDFTVVAQIESAGNTCTLDASLRATTNVAAEPTDALIAAATQVSVTSDTAVEQHKFIGQPPGSASLVARGKTYYILITATTAASTDIILQACDVKTTRGVVEDFSNLVGNFAQKQIGWVTELIRTDSSASQWWSLAKVHSSLSTLANEPLLVKIYNGGLGDLTGGHANNTATFYTEYGVLRV